MKTKHLKLIMELIFIFIIPLILICGTSSIEKTYVYDNEGNFETSEIELSFDNSIIKYNNGYKNVIENFNIWNEEWEIGGYNSTNGLKNNATNTIRGKNLIEVIPNTNYYIPLSEYDTNNYGISLVCYYDNNQDFISFEYNTSGTRTTPNNCYYISITFNSAYGLIYNNNICLNISVNWANGNYVTYGEPLILYTNTDVSGQNDINYTIWGNIKELLIDNLNLNDSILLDLIICYTILWFIMFILWHFFYLVFDGLVHLFIDWKKRSD